MVNKDHNWLFFIKPKINTSKINMLVKYVAHFKASMKNSINTISVSRRIQLLWKCEYLYPARHALRYGIQVDYLPLVMLC